MWWWWVACAPQPEPFPTVPTAPEADADTDADSDTDTDTDADTDPTPADWPGTPGTFQDTTAGRDWTLYVPPSYDAVGGSPLVVAFHGAGDTGANFFAVARAIGWTDAADDLGFLLLVPDTRSPYSDFAVWSGNPSNDFDEMDVELDDVLALVDTIGQTWHLDPDQLHATGFSDGGLFVAVAGFGRADRFATLAIEGYGWGGFSLVDPPRPLPVQLVCGTNDSFYGYAQQSASWLSGAGHEVRFEAVPGVGHSFSGLTGGVPADDLVGWMLSRPR